MTSAKRNRSIRKVGHRRGVPVRLARDIAKKYSLSHVVIFTADLERRSRGLYWARNNLAAMQCANFCEKAERELGWESVWDWDCSSVRRLKDRIKELETALAQIVDGAEDPIGLARSAGKFPNESEGENLGAWIFYPSGKLNPDRAGDSLSAPRRVPAVGEARRRHDLKAV